MLAERGPSSEVETEVATAAAAAFGRAFTRTEFDPFLDLLAPEAEFEVPSVMQSTVLKLRGRDEIRSYLEETTGEYTKLAVSLTDIRDQGAGRFVVVGSWRAQPSHSPTTLGTPMAAVLDIADGKVGRILAFFDEQLAVAAAGRD